MKMFKRMILSSSFVIAPAFFVAAHAAEPTAGEKVEEAYKDAKKDIKKGYRKAQDETCQMINGKLECAAKKMGRKAKDAADEIKEKAEENEKHTK